MKPYIPQPCHEDWNAMTQKEQGRFCDSCAKVVVDFTSMNDEEIVEYLQQHSKQKTCGHFKNEQLYQTEKIEIDISTIPKDIPIRSLFFTCLIIAFSSIFLVSCTSCMMGKVEMKDHKIDSTQGSLNKPLTGAVISKPDTTCNSEMGEVAFSKDSVKLNHPLPPKPIKPKIKFVELTAKGEVEMIPIKEDTTGHEIMGKSVLSEEK